MKLLTIICGLSLSLTSTIHINAQKNEKPDAASIINKSINAMGGKELLLSIRTLYCEMSTKMEGRSVVWVTKEMLPNKGAFQIVYNNRIVFHNFYDGITGYEMVDGQKQKADPDEFKNKAYKKNIFNELDYLDSSIYTIDLVGEAKVNKEPCYKIKATCINGEEKLLYFSKNNFHQLRKETIANGEKDRLSVSEYSDFKQFGKLTYYTTLKFGDAGDLETGKIEKLLINEQVSEADFK